MMTITLNLSNLETEVLNGVIAHARAAANSELIIYINISKSRQRRLMAVKRLEKKVKKAIRNLPPAGGD